MICSDALIFLFLKDFYQSTRQKYKINIKMAKIYKSLIFLTLVTWVGSTIYIFSIVMAQHKFRTCNLQLKIRSISEPHEKIHFAPLY
jgi:hypothetical protein